MKTVTTIRLLAATVWLVFGVLFKLLDLVPRHREIVAAILGDRLATPVTVAVGLAEVGLAIWILSGILPLVCAVAQTAAITSMNILEIALARELLLAPVAMVLANILFLALVWYAALETVRHRGRPNGTRKDSLPRITGPGTRHS